MLLRIFNGMRGFRPASIAPLTRLTVPFTASETSATVDFGSGTGSECVNSRINWGGLWLDVSDSLYIGRLRQAEADLVTS
jgi:hypothetical protein